MAASSITATTLQSRLPTILGIGAAAVAVGATVRFLNQKAASSSSNSDDNFLSSYPYLQRDGSLAVSIQELSGLYSRVDEALFEELLKSLEELMSLQGTPDSIRTGQRNVARALRAKRRGNAALSDLRNGARRRFPSQAIDAAEDEKVVGRAITDILHNIQQSCTLAPPQ